MTHPQHTSYEKRNKLNEVFQRHMSIGYFKIKPKFTQQSLQYPKINLLYRHYTFGSFNPLDSLNAILIILITILASVKLLLAH